MTKDDYFAELAKDCVRACHTLKSVTEGSNVGNVGGGPGQKLVEDLGRCVDQV